MPPVSPTMSTSASLRAAPARSGIAEPKRRSGYASACREAREADVNSPVARAGAELTVARRKPPEGFGRLAAALASSDAGRAADRAPSRPAHRHDPWVTIVRRDHLRRCCAHPSDHFALGRASRSSCSPAFQTHPPAAADRLAAGSRILVIFELALTVGAITATGGLASPFILTPITGLLLAGYVWGRRPRSAPRSPARSRPRPRSPCSRSTRPTSGAAGQIAVIFLLCGALGAFTRNLVTEIESHRAAAIDQATQMATANDLLVSLHGLAQTLPASFDLGEVVESIRQRLRSLVPLHRARRARARRRAVGLAVELAEGVRLPARIERPRPPAAAPARRSTSSHPVVDRRPARPEPDEGGFAALARSGLYTALRRPGRARRPGRDRTRPARRVRRRAARPARVPLEPARALARQRPLVRPPAHPRRRGRAGPHRPRAPRPDRPVARLRRVRARAAPDLPGDKDDEIDKLHERRPRHHAGAPRDDLPAARRTSARTRTSSRSPPTTSTASRSAPGSSTHWRRRHRAALPYRVEQELWRIVQEALVNVERHSGATEVVVRWEVDDGRRPPRSLRRRHGLRPRPGRRRPLRHRRHAGTGRRDRRPARDREPSRPGNEGRRRAGLTGQQASERRSA